MILRWITEMRLRVALHITVLRDYYKLSILQARWKYSFYPDKSGSVPTAEIIVKRSIRDIVQSVKDFCKNE